MEPLEIQNRLKSKDVNYAILAEAVDVTPSHVRNVVEKIAISRRVAEAIAVAIEEPFAAVFPEYEEKTSRARTKKRKQVVAALKKKIAKVV